MAILKLVHPVYVLLRKVMTASRLSRPLRSRLGPLAGRMVSRVMVNPRQPSTVFGHKMILATSGSYPPAAMAMDRYEKETTSLFENLIKTGMVIVDVGGHVGYYSLLAARQVGPTGKVYTFEPEPSNHKLLLGNIERNGYTNIVAMRKGVSNFVGTMPLFLTALDNGRHSAYQHGLPERGRITIETTTLDAFLESVGWPRVDLVKVDVEGAEADVLEGMGKLLAHSPHLTLIVEFSPTLLIGAAADPFQFLQQFPASEFKVSCIEDKLGPVALPEEEYSPLIEDLLKSEGSINLLCSRE